MLSQDAKGQLEGFQRHLVGKQKVVVINPLDSNSSTGGVHVSSKFFPRIHSLSVSIWCLINKNKNVFFAHVYVCVRVYVSNRSDTIL